MAEYKTVNPNSHNRLVTGSNPAEPTFAANSTQNAPDSFKKAQVLPELTESLQFRELLYILLGNKGRRQLELRQKTNNERNQKVIKLSCQYEYCRTIR